MNVLVTGSAGFVGKHLIRYLRGEGHNVTEYDLATGQDLLNRKQLDDTFAAGRFDQVYHVAAQAFMRAGRITRSLTLK